MLFGWETWVETAKEMWGSSSNKLSGTERYILEILGRENELVTDDSNNVQEIEYSQLSIRNIVEYIKLFYSQNISYQTVQRSLNKLIEKGLVEKSDTSQGKRTTYWITGNNDEVKKSAAIIETVEPPRVLKIDNT